jgi:RNA polymerase sigma-70 factor (ECF subfamily)
LNLPDDGLLKLPCEKDLTAPCVYESTVVRLFKTQATKIRRFLSYRLRNSEDAKDAAQELFLRLWTHEQEGNLKEDAVAYMNAAAGNIAIDIERRRKSRGFDQQETFDTQELPPSTIDEGDALHWRRGVEVLVYSLQELPEITQQVFVLHHFENLSHAAIAEKLAISIRTVERHMARALKHCKECLGDYL